MSAEASGFLTVAQFAQQVGLSARKVYALIHGEAVAHHKHGDTYRIPDTEVPAYLARTYVPVKPEGESRDDDTAAPPRSTPPQERVA